MSRQNPVYPPIIQYLNKLSVGKIFTIEDVSKSFPNLSIKYLTSVIRSLATKDFYIGKIMDEVKKRKINGYVKRRNIPTDKTYTDICWFLKYDL